MQVKLSWKGGAAMVVAILRRLYLPVALSLALTLGAGTAYSQKARPFWEGKRVKMINRSTPGGGYDLISRVVARELPKYLPGVGSLIVVNVPGAGGLVAASQMYHKVAPDGLTMGLLDRTAPIGQLLRPELVKTADFRHFRYLGSLMQDVPVLVIRNGTGIRSMDELIKSKEQFVPGGTGKAAAGYQIPFAMQKAWNLPFTKWVLGYPGAAEQVAAMQRGENDLIGTTADSLAALHLLRETGNPLVIAARERDKRFPDVPTVFEVAARYPPDPRYWPLVELLVDAGAWGRPFVVPPGISEDRLGILRDVFARTFKDEELVSRAEKMGLFANPVAGEKQEGLIRQALSPSAEVLELLKLYE